MHVLINTVLGDVASVHYADDEMLPVTITVIERTPARADHPVKSFQATKIPLEQITQSIELNKTTSVSKNSGGFA